MNQKTNNKKPIINNPYEQIEKETLNKVQKGRKPRSDNLFQELLGINQQKPPAKEENQLKKAVEDIADAFNPIKWFQELLGIPEDQTNLSEQERQEFYRRNNSTPIDSKKLGEKYREKDMEQEKKVRERIRRHREFMEEEKAYLDQKKQLEIARKKREMEEEEKKKAEEKRKKQEQLIIPQGKQRRSILQGLTKKKKAVNPFEIYHPDKKQ
ncbi:MAG: hypothetical protein KatS3mg090_0382 [Patescibacteria group bacterium]|nr:MAG: hypothetical protein KatS3mg090_0382 [Patescibacteria group bacterium]